MTVELGVNPVSDTQVEVGVQPQPPTPTVPVEERAVPAEAELVTAHPRIRGRKASASGFPWERPPLARFSMHELPDEVEARRARAAGLERERLRVRKELAEIECELEAMGVAVASATESTPQPA